MVSRGRPPTLPLREATRERYVISTLERNVPGHVEPRSQEPQKTHRDHSRHPSPSRKRKNPGSLRP
eukprot:13190768-Alexandrium_andersonii.AAC.1